MTNRIVTDYNRIALTARFLVLHKGDLSVWERRPGTGHADLLLINWYGDVIPPAADGGTWASQSRYRFIELTHDEYAAIEMLAHHKSSTERWVASVLRLVGVSADDLQEVAP